MFDNVRADLARFGEGWRPRLRGMLSQGFQAIVVYRFFRWCHVRSIPTQPLRFVVERVIEITTGIQIPASCEIGPGLRIHHFGGIIFHPTVRLGAQCTLYQGVTIGDRGGSGGAAEVGDRVTFGAGAVVTGEIVIGDDCFVGANAVVRESVPAGHLAVGNPATVKQRRPTVAS